MSASAPLAVPNADVAAASDAISALATLRLAGAHKADPVQFHYLEVLAKRATHQPEAVQRLLTTALSKGLAALCARLAQVQGTVAQPSKPSHGPLGELTRYVAQHAVATAGEAANEADAAPSELKAVRAFRKTWSQFSVDKQLNQALGLAPKNAGPINSHMLVLRSLAQMRDISPDYLNRFISYVDALQCLDQANQGQALGAEQAGADDKGKKLRAPRKTSRTPAKREK